MKITIHNYKEAEAKIDWSKASDGLNTGKAFTQKWNAKYDRTAAAKTTIDAYFLLMEKFLGQSAPEPKKKASPAAPAKKAAKTVVQKPGTKAKKPAKAAPEEPKVDAAIVEHIPSDIALVKRYISLHGKDKTYDQVLSIWRAFNKAIVERKVTKDSPYKSEIATMNNGLKSALEQARAVGALHLTLSAAKLKAYKAIADSVEKSAGVGIMLEFVNISGRTGMKERAGKLLQRIERAAGSGKLDDDRYSKDIRKAKTAIEAYLNSENDVVNLNDYALNGIGEIAVFGCPCDKDLAGFTRSQNAVIYKLIQEKVRNLQDCELDRAFSDTVAPSLCKTIAQKLIQARQLTMSLLRNPAKVTGSVALSGSGRNYGFDINTEIMDMRLRDAGVKASGAKATKHSGLSGTAQIIPFEAPGEDLKIMSANELVNQKFRTMGLQGKYRKLIGDPEPGFSAMVYGKPKQGKSTVAIDMAKEFTRYGKVLYCAFEEGHGYTLQDKVIRNRANVPGLDFANKLPGNLSMYQFVFVDSVSDAGMDEVAFKSLIKSNKPRTSIFGIFHATKGGNFRGGQTFAHDVDVLIRVEDGMAYAQGRYAPPGEISIAAILPDSPAQAA
jgi:hypothetical protein